MYFCMIYRYINRQILMFIKHQLISYINTEQLILSIFAIYVKEKKRNSQNTQLQKINIRAYDLIVFKNMENQQICIK